MGGGNIRVGACVIAYNRPDYFGHVATSIAMNAAAYHIPFHFFLDGGAGAKQEEHIAIIDRLAVPGKHVVRRPEHYGCEANTVEAHIEMFDACRYDLVIHLEDDLLLSPYYLDTLMRLHAWSEATYDNVAAVQGWDRCLLSRTEKMLNLSRVRSHYTSSHWWGYLINRRAWERMREVLLDYRRMFLDGRRGNDLDHDGVRAFMRRVVRDGPETVDGHTVPPEPGVGQAFLDPCVATGNDAIHALAMWRAGLVRLCTVVNRAVCIGRVGLHGTDEFFENSRLHDVRLDQLDGCRVPEQYELVS